MVAWSTRKDPHSNSSVSLRIPLTWVEVANVAQAELDGHSLTVVRACLRCLWTMCTGLSVCVPGIVDR